MSKHQLRLHGSKKKRADIDGERIGKFLRGTADLRETIGIRESHTCDLRTQAHALYDSAKWERVIDVVLALAALGDMEPFDAVLIARAYHELGDGRNAALWGSAAERMLGTLDAIIRQDASAAGAGSESR